jgi:AsmA-like protein
MSFHFRRHARKIILILLVLAFAGWWGPRFLSAERYRERVRLGLERSLGRQVSFGALTFHLLPRPGFTLDNVVIGEDAAFGAEPFARMDRMDCDLRLRGLLRWRLEVLRLSVERPSFNIARNASGQWNLQSLLGRQGSGAPSSELVAPSNLHLEASDARINFKLGEDKKPLAIDGVEGWLDFDRTRHGVRFRLTGNPVRTDLLFPSPGELEFNGEWMPGERKGGPLDATLTARSAMLYDWVPILTGRNPEIYGVMEANAHLTGSFRILNAEGRIRMSQLHRWDQPPPAGGLDSNIFFRGQYDREHSRLVFESVDAAFADSHLHLTGSVDGIGAQPELDLVLAVERSRLEDFQTLAARFTERLRNWSASGRVDALMTVQGLWTDRRYGGFVQIRDVRLTTPAGSYPVSEIALRIDRDGARLAPFTLDLAPRVTLVAEGSVGRKNPAKNRHSKSRNDEPLAPFEYKLDLIAKSVPLRELVRFARGIGIHIAEGMDAQGEATASFTLTGPVPPRGTPPAVAALVDLRAASLLIPGFTEPLNIPRAHVQVRDSVITANPVVAVLGTSVFIGRLEHAGGRREPWQFDVRTSALSIEQGALWFDVLGNRQPVPLLLRLPGLSSLVERRTAASSLFGALNARGRFTTARLTYRALTIRDFQADVEIADRVIRLSGNFHAGGGRGTGKLAVDLTQSPARVVADAALTDAGLQPLTPFLPAAFRQTHGTYSVSGNFGTVGLSRQEIATNLEGHATVQLKNVNFGEFDPLGALARANGRIYSDQVRGDAAVRSAIFDLQIKDKRVTAASSPFLLSGANVQLQGWCDFSGAADVSVIAGFRAVNRRVAVEGAGAFDTRPLRVHFVGPFGKLAVEPAPELSRANP